jgi:hypothetical protein
LVIPDVHNGIFVINRHKGCKSPDFIRDEILPYIRVVELKVKQLFIINNFIRFQGGSFAIVDVENNTAFHLKAWQTPGVNNLDAVLFNLLSHYVSIISENAKTFKEISDYMVADAYFSKKGIFDTVLGVKLHFISRLRDDSVRVYNYYGEPTGKRGRPRKVEGSINVNEPDANYFYKQICNEDLTIYTAVVHY